MLEISKSRVFEDIRDRIETAILAQRLKPGDKLPPERELQERFSASRGTVREALRSLEQKGLIEIKKGARGGAFVKPLGIDQISETLAILISHRRISVKHLAEFREVLEGTAATLAAERATEQEISELKGIYENASACTQKKTSHFVEFYRAEIAVHQKIAEMSGNPLIEWVLSTLHRNMASYDLLMPSDMEMAQEALGDWQEIMRAIASRDIAKAGLLMKSHISHFRHSMRGVP